MYCRSLVINVEEMELYWIDTGWACGGVIVNKNIIVETAPIFSKFMGQSINKLLNWKQVKSYMCFTANSI